MKLKLTAIALALLAASCAPIPSDTTFNPLNVPGEDEHYIETDIHHRLFAADYGH